MSENGYPLTALQQSMVYRSLLSPNSGLYVQQLEGRLNETLDVPSFKESWRKLLAHCDVLKTHLLPTSTGAYLQEIAADSRPEWVETDWSGFSKGEQNEKWRVYLTNDRRRGFDFSQAPLMRLALFRLGVSEFRFLWTFHHALLDGRSHLAIIKELFCCYDALKANRDCRFADTTPFGEFARWLAKHDHGESRPFWLKSLKGLEMATRPAIATPNVQPQAYEEERATIATYLTKEQTEELRSFATAHDLTLGTLVHGAWAVLLSRYSGEEDVVFGTTRACRHASVPGSESILGLLINTVPLRIRVEAETPTLEWLKGIRSHWVAMRPHEHTPLQAIQEWNGFRPDKPLVDNLLVYEDSSLNELFKSQGGAWLNREFELHERGDFPLVALGYGGSRLLLRLAYSRGDLEDETARRILAHWRTLLLCLKTHPLTPVADLPMLSPQELKTLLHDWNNTLKRHTEDSCIHQLVEAQVARTPNNTAVLAEKECLTYAELNTRANRLAHHLRATGVGPEVRVALCLERGTELIIAVIAILKAGGAYVPLEADQPEARLREMLTASRALLLVTQASLLGKFVSHGVPAICVDGDQEAIVSCSDANPESDVSPGNLAYALYTSGSTGRPKLIGVEHRNAVNFLHYTTQVAYDSADLAIVPFADAISFDPSVYRMFSALSTGGSLVLLQSLFDLPHSHWGDSITLLGGAPSVMSALLSDFSLPPSVRVASFGAEVPSEALIEKLRHYSQLDRIYNFYGPTETTIYCTHAVLARRPRLALPPGGPQLVRMTKPTVIGKPIWNVRIYILDKRMRPVPPGVGGEICVGGACVTRGYLDQPELTAEKFIRDPFSSSAADRLYKTGDLGRFLPDGNIEFLGRMDDQVKIRGLRVEPQGIAAVLGENPAVHECIVRAMRDPAGILHLVAYVVLRPGKKGSPQDTKPQTEREDQLRAFLESRLPRWMLPEEFVLIKAMPRTVRGKIDFKMLPQPRLAAGKEHSSYESPRTDVEKTLVQIWQEVLHPRRVGIHDTFLELGGDSLAGMRIINRTNRAFGTKLSMQTIFEAPTIADLAHAVRNGLPHQ